MNRPLAISDVDGTRFKSSCVEKATEVAIQQGVFRAEDFGKTYEKRRLWQTDNNEGIYQSYLHQLVGDFVTSLAGVEVDKFKAVVDQMVGEHRVRLFSFTRRLGEILYPSHEQIAISGSPDFLIEPFLNGMGFDATYGSSFEVENGRYTGQATSVNKTATVDELVMANRVIDVAVGDTVGDKSVLEQAVCPIAFNPSATLRRIAIGNRWPIVIEQKDAITQLIPQDNGYEAVFERSPTIILDAMGVSI